MAVDITWIINNWHDLGIGGNIAYFIYSKTVHLKGLADPFVQHKGFIPWNNLQT